MTLQKKALLYQKKLASYQAFLGGLVEDAQAINFRAEHQFECLQDWSLLHSLEEVREWFCAQRTNCPMQVTDIPLKETKGWLIHPDTGNITHESGSFFSIHGVRISQSAQREVGSKGWDQPILEQIGYDGGILGLIRKRFDGIPHYLIEAKAEPGNYQMIQMSPTLQATFSNLQRAHKGRKPRFAEYFEEPEQHQASVLYDQWLSEDGGRLHNKRNKGMLVEIPEEHKIQVPDSFIWMSMFQIKACLQENAWVNPHIRGIIAHL